MTPLEAFLQQIAGIAVAHVQQTFDVRIIETIFDEIQHDSVLYASYVKLCPTLKAKKTLHQRIGRKVRDAVDGEVDGRSIAKPGALISSFSLLRQNPYQAAPISLPTTSPVTATSLAAQRRQLIESKRAAAEMWFKSHLYPTGKCAYILQVNHWESNILEPGVSTYLKSLWQQKRLRLHSWIHHGLSSQAFLFNLFRPQQVGLDQSLTTALANKLGIAPATVSDFTLEYQDASQLNEKQSTSIDLKIEYGNQHVVFVEGKFTEPGFGRCSVFETGGCLGANAATIPQQCYLTQIGCQYWQKLSQHGFLSLPGGLSHDSICAFGIFYQFFREFLFMLEYQQQTGRDCHYVVLHDGKNQAFADLQQLLDPYLPPVLKHHLHVLTVQDILHGIKTPWAAELIQRYDL